MNTQSIASVSLDLDNKWSYMKTHGDPGWESFPSYLDIVVPRVLAFLAERNMRITFFVVGQDAALPGNAEVLSSISAAGHEIGNHSFSHEPWFHLYDEATTEREIGEAEEHIERVTGQRPVGFRGPGFSCSKTTLEVLMRHGYLFDASSFPTFLGPLARAYYFLKTRGLTKEEWDKRKQLFGGLRDGLRPLTPYCWRSDNNELLEIPVTTMPVLRIPIHVSYVLYLSSYSPALASAYFNTALNVCRATGTQPSLLLHPLDFIGCDDISELSFFPAMNLPAARKLEVVSGVMQSLASRFTPVTMKQHAIEARNRARTVSVSSAPTPANLRPSPVVGVAHDVAAPSVHDHQSSRN